MQPDEINNTVKKIKSGFRLQMNGVASSSMREKGIGGYLNWGIQLPALRKIAEEYGKDYDLAVALWKENVRECKILATIIMPAERMDGGMLSLWMEQTENQEIAEYAAFNLYQYTSEASIYGYLWIASGNELAQICGYNLLACLFRKGSLPSDRDINEFIDQAIAAVQDSSATVRHAAMNSLNTFAEMGDLQASIVDSALKRCM